MLIGVLFAILACLCGVAVNRPVRAPLSLAPFSGLAAIAVLTAWCAQLGAPPLTGTTAVVALALLGLIVLVGEPAASRTVAEAIRQQRAAATLLLAAVAVPTALLGAALAGVDAPISTHDGAFHVETVDNLRRGVAVVGWYPMAFHTSVAGVLRLVPWVDSARGTAETAIALATLAPLGIFALARGLGLDTRLASVGALVMALTYIYPYDDQMWAGWPLAMSLLLMLGLWAVAARWTFEPRAGLALLGGLFAGAILLTHGTEVYSSAIGLAVIAAVRWRSIRLDRLAMYLPLAITGAVVCALPYVATLVGFVAAGEASNAGASALDAAAAQGSANNGGDWLDVTLGLTGAGGVIDLTARAVLLALGARHKDLRLVFVGWLVFGALVLTVSFVDAEPVRHLYTLTYPWLVHHRPPQLVVMFASLLVAGGLVQAVGWGGSLRSRLGADAWRRMAAVSGALLLFLAEGSVVTIFKTLDAVIAQQNVYLADDRAAMSWLRQNAAPGDMLINDAAADAGIWAPYKAGLPVLLPRSGVDGEEQRDSILENLLALASSPSEAASACALRADYVFVGSRRVEGDAPALPKRSLLEQAPGIQEVFASGDAAIFRVQLNCG